MLRKLLIVVALSACALGTVAPESFGRAMQRKKAIAKQQTAKQQTTAKAARYVCPMHPEVVSTKPGACPKCRMALRRQADDATPAAAAVTAANNNDVATTTNEKATATAAPAAAIAATAPDADAAPQIPDVNVLDQTGQPLRFYTDLVKGRTVAINFIFTTCTTICPPLTATMRRVQQTLGERVGRDVELISVSVDPATDTPARLADFSAKFKAAPGWTFVTGNKPEIDNLLRALGVAVGDKTEHTPLLLIINDRTKKWTRTSGLATPATISALITETADVK